MGNGLEVKDQKVIYLNGHQLINTPFDNVVTYKEHLIAYDWKHLAIVSPSGDLLLFEEGIILQVSCGYVTMRKGNVMGVFRYDGALVVPFEFYSAFICDSERIDVKVNSDSEYTPLFLSKT